MADLKSQEIASMQADAIKRVRLMQELARKKVSESQPVVSNEAPALDEITTFINRKDEQVKRPQDCQKHNKPKTNQNRSNRRVSNRDDFISTLFKKILPNLESDRILILFLIFMLQKEDVDQSLILALLYMAI